MTNQLPAYLQNKASRGLAQSLVANLGAGSPPFLSIMGNRLTLIDSAGEEIPVSTYDPKLGPYLDCAIIDALERTSKIYYDKPFDPSANQYEPPPCFSDNGVAPSRSAAKPQSPTCAGCQWNAWGSKTSAISGKQVKACNDIQKVAVLVPGYEMPFLVRIPPGSRTHFRSYVNKFVGQPIDVCDVTTRIYFQAGVNGILEFAAVGYIDEATFGQREKLALAHATDALVGRTDLPIQGALPAAQQAPLIEHQATSSVVVADGSGTVGAAPQQPAPQPQQTQQRRRRNTADAQPHSVSPASSGQAPQPAQQAPFMPQQLQGNFGMAQGAAPDPALQNTLDSLFKK